MPDQFVVPQFLDVESKIIGPITARQFVILIAVVLIEFVIYRLFLSLLPILVLGIPVLALGVAFAFVKVNDRPFHYIVLNMIQTFKRPMVRVWDKRLTDREIKAHFKKDDVLKPPPPSRKVHPRASRLSELSLVVNTGGVYQPEETYGK